ncbi:hypothetical protein TYRP_020664 [Tyrophagus putrescentiae]|nr:hypothetical protein TYRP_007097 [Tyrophagus putrescentiae]KAH9395635.1 hypothetical protein TYRP_020664 [Tyrophagus putrescentiae]
MSKVIKRSASGQLISRAKGKEGGGGVDCGGGQVEGTRVDHTLTARTCLTNNESNETKRDASDDMENMDNNDNDIVSDIVISVCLAAAVN